MKQVLLRVPDEVHRGLTARAAREGRSVNALATEMLRAAADADIGDRQARLRARAAALGLLVSVPRTREPMTEDARRVALESTRGLGPFIDKYLAEERERL